MEKNDVLINELLKDFIENYEGNDLDDLKTCLKGFVLEHAFNHFNDYREENEMAIGVRFLEELNKLLVRSNTPTSYLVIELPKFYENEMPMNVRLFLELFEGEEYEKYLSRYLLFSHIANRTHTPPFRPSDYAFIEVVYHHFDTLEQNTNSYHYIKKLLHKRCDDRPKFQTDNAIWTSDALTFMMSIDVFDNYLKITPIKDFLNKRKIENKETHCLRYLNHAALKYQYVVTLCKEMSENYIEEMNYYLHAK